MEEEEEKRRTSVYSMMTTTMLMITANVDAWVETESIVLERDNECDVVRAIAWSKRSDGIVL